MRKRNNYNVLLQLWNTPYTVKLFSYFLTCSGQHLDNSILKQPLISLRNHGGIKLLKSREIPISFQKSKGNWSRAQSKSIVHLTIYNYKYNCFFSIHSTRQFKFHAWMGLFLANWLVNWEISELTIVITIQLTFNWLN